MENITDGSMNTNDLIIDCADLTNNGLYAIFVGLRNAIKNFKKIIK